MQRQRGAPVGDQVEPAGEVSGLTERAARAFPWGGRPGLCMAGGDRRGLRGPLGWLEPRLYPLLAVWLWASYQPSPSPSLFIYDMRIIIVRSQGRCENEISRRRQSMGQQARSLSYTWPATCLKKSLIGIKHAHAWMYFLRLFLSCSVRAEQL